MKQCKTEVEEVCLITEICSQMGMLHNSHNTPHTIANKGQDRDSTCPEESPHARAGPPEWIVM